MTIKFSVLIINGPNINLLGMREPDIYGKKTLAEINTDLNTLGNNLGVVTNFFQSNIEGNIIDRIHQAYSNTNFIIINPSAFTHTSIALRDALLGVNIPFIEIHLSNILSREKFRHHSYFSDIAIGVIYGFGINGYTFALKAAIKYLSTK